MYIKNKILSKNTYIIVLAVLFIGISSSCKPKNRLDLDFFGFHLGSSTNEAKNVAEKYKINFIKKSDKDNEEIYYYEGAPVLVGGYETGLYFWKDKLYKVCFFYNGNQYSALKSIIDGKFGQTKKKETKKCFIRKNGMEIVINYQADKDRTLCLAKHLNKTQKVRLKKENKNNNVQYIELGNITKNNKQDSKKENQSSDKPDMDFFGFQLGRSIEEAMEVVDNYKLDYLGIDFINNLRAYRYKGTPIEKGGTTILIFREGKLYEVTFLSEEDKYNELKQLVKKSFGNFKEKKIGKNRAYFTKKLMEITVEGDDDSSSINAKLKKVKNR